MALVDKVVGDKEAGLVRTNPQDDKVTGYQATQVAYDQDKDSIQAAARRIIAEESPIQRQAVTRATQGMQARGLVNSSLNTQAAQAAVYDYAVPMATNDVANSLGVRTANAQALNQSRGTLAQAQNQSRTIEQQKKAEQDLINTRLEGELKLQNDTQQHDVQMQGLDAETRIRLQQLSGDQAQDLARLEGEYAKIAQTSQAAGVYFATMSQSLGEILAEPNMTTQVKQQLIDKLQQSARTFLGVIGGIADLDLNDLLASAGLTPAGTPTTPTAPADGRPAGYPDYLPWPPVFTG